MSTLSRVVFDPDTTPPSVPSAVTVTSQSTTTLRVSWSAATDTGGSRLAGYRVYRSTTSTGTYSQIGSDLSVASLTYDDTSLSASTTRYYRVVAFDGRGNVSSQSTTASGTTQSAAASPLYETTFTEFSIGSAPTGGNAFFQWNGINISGGGTPNQVQVVDTGGNRALRFRWQPLLSWAEARFRLPTRQTEVWIKQTTSLDSDFAYNAGTASDEPGLNNKMFVALWSAHENSALWNGTEDYGGSQRGPGHDINAWPRSGSEMCRHTMYTWGGGGLMDTHGITKTKIGTPNEGNDISPLFQNSDAGTTFDFYTHIKYATSADNDGVIKTWIVRNGVVTPLLQLTTCRSYVPGQLGFSHGYMHGYANARFAVQTDILMHYFGFANTNVWGVVS